MRVLVCGGRDYNDLAKVKSTLGDFHNEHGIDLLIEGGATGADFLAREWARWKFIAVETFEADWNDLSHPDAIIRTRRDGTKYDAKAGIRRNNRMLVEGKPDRVIAFPGAKGTADMIRQARDAGVKVIEVK